jgi:hypothetical protein
MIVTVTPTISDGTVVRWYTSERAAKNRAAAVTASRHRVTVDASFTTAEEASVLRALMFDAEAAMQRLSLGLPVEDRASHEITPDGVVPIGAATVAEELAGQSTEPSEPARKASGVRSVPGGEQGPPA